MRTANLAIVFTDIKDFTRRTSQQTYEQNQRMLQVHDALLTPVFKSFGGRVIKAIGDAFLVVFDSPTQAVLCGVALQDRLWDYNRRVLESERILVRVAVNMGEVRVERGDIFGEPVNIAARVEGVADAGEVLFTEAVYLSMNKAEVPSEERGLFELKGIPEKVRVYRVPPGGYRLEAKAVDQPATVAEGVPAESPPYGGIALARLQNLPPPDPENLKGTNELLQNLGSLASGAARGARGLGERLRGVDLGGRLRALPPKARRVAAAAAGLALLVLLASALAMLLGGHPVERAVEDGDFELARRELERVQEKPLWNYLDGRIREAREDWDGAARRYEQAAKAGEGQAFDRLIEMTESPVCRARAEAAAQLGRLGDRSALGALKDLEGTDFPDEREQEGLKSLFGCKSRKVAREAISRLEAKGG